MPLVIPDNASNWIVHISNASGGASANSSIALGLGHPDPLDQAIVGRVANLFRDGLTGLYDNSWLVGPVHVNENDGGVERVWDDSGTEAGTAASTTYCPPAAAFVVTKVTGLSGRAHRGRVYLPGVREDVVDEAGSITGGRVTEVNTAMNNLRTALLADAAITEVLLFHDSASPGDHSADVIQSFNCRTVVGTMRPRQRR